MTKNDAKISLAFKENVLFGQAFDQNRLALGSPAWRDDSALQPHTAQKNQVMMMPYVLHRLGKISKFYQVPGEHRYIMVYTYIYVHMNLLVQI